MLIALNVTSNSWFRALKHLCEFDVPRVIPQPDVHSAITILRSNY